MKKRFGIKSLILWLLVILWMIVIFKMSSEDGIISGGRSKRVAVLVKQTLVPLKNIHQNKMPEAHILEFIIRKTGHVTEYLILSFLLMIALSNSNKNRYFAYIFAFLLAMIYAVLDEYHQVFIPWRDGRMSDILIDSIGVLLGIFAYNLRNMFIKNKIKHNKQAI